MGLPIIEVAGRAVGFLRTVLQRKAVQRAVGAVAVATGTKIVGPLVTPDNLIPLIDAVANLVIAVGTAIAIAKGYRTRAVERPANDA